MFVRWFFRYAVLKVWLWKPALIVAVLDCFVLLKKMWRPLLLFLGQVVRAEQYEGQLFWLWLQLWLHQKERSWIWRP